jgi:hypothetical protein
MSEKSIAYEVCLQMTDFMCTQAHHKQIIADSC